MEGLSACECPVCFFLLNHSTREPMSMPCGHTLCKVCVQQLGERSTNTATRSGSKARPTFQCPICRLWVNVETISLNVTLRDLLSELGKMENKRVLPLGTALNVSYSEVAVEQVLDRGAFGEVCRANWRGNEVAVKLFSTGRPTPETMEAFQREVFVMNCLRHPNVVLLLGACQTPPTLAIIMEYVAGGSLHQLVHVDKKLLSEIEIAQLATDICRGLQYLHSINVLHRDLKSKNVLLTGPIPCQVKLCDFGLSRMRQESATMTGNIGTVHWTAPEVLNNERYRFPADVYGFGMVMYEMVYGRVPRGHMAPVAVMLAVAIKRERPEIPDSAHPTLKQLIRDCSEWIPEGRPSLPSILTSLSSLLPHPQTTRDEKRGRGMLTHQDSLGVVFLSATDSADLSNQDSSLAQLAHQYQAPPPDNQTPPPGNQAPPTDHQAPPTDPLRKRSYEDLVLSPDVPLTNQEVTSVNMAIATNPVYISVDERTSLNMALATEPIRQPPSSPPWRRQALGEGHAPWQRYTRHQETSEGMQQETIDQGTGDQAVARELQAQLLRAQEQTDRELAEQLQMKENSFRATDTVAPPTSVFPPQPLLDTIKSKKFPQLKHVEATPTDATPTESVPLKKRLGSLLSKARYKMRKSGNTSPADVTAAPPSGTRPSSKNKSTAAKLQATPPAHVPRGQVSFAASKSAPVFGDYQNIAGFSHYDDYATPQTMKTTVGTMSGTYRPPPPPPPPPPPSLRLLSPRQHLLREVQSRAPTVARQLRPVQTIEKRAFRVGRVVGGYDSQQGLFTTQNMIESFNRHRLMPVTVREPTPPFPVGRVVQSRHKVKRMSSHLESAMSPEATPSVPPPLPPLPSSPPRRRLHPAIQSAVARFSRENLHHVDTVVKQKLPDSREVEQEKRSQVIQEILDFDHSLLMNVETVYKDKLPSADVLEIERRQVMDSDLTHAKDLILHSVLTFDPSGLHHVVTEVKNRLPSIGTIELERKNMEDRGT